MGRENPGPAERNIRNKIDINPRDFSITPDKRLSTTYHISAGEQPFANFQTSGDGPVQFIWRSNLDFSAIDNSVGELSELILNKKVDPYDVASPKVTAFLHNGKDNKESFEIDDFFQYQEFHDRLAHENSYDSVSYLLNDSLDGKAFYVRVPAPKKLPSQSRNVAVALAMHKDAFFGTPGLSQWVMEHHHLKASFKARNIKSEAIFHGIAEAINYNEGQ